MEFKNILVNALPRESDDPAMQVASRLARQFASRLTLFDVKADFSWPLQYLVGGWERTIETLSAGKEKLLADQAEALNGKGIEADYKVAEGRLSAATVRQVLEEKHDLVVRMAEGPGSNRSGFLGSTDFRLLRKCPCPVLILKPGASEFHNLVVALDVLDKHEIQRELDQRVLDAAMALCQGTIQLIYALHPVDESVHVQPEDADMITMDQLKQWEADLVAEATKNLQAARQTIASIPGECHVIRGTPEDAVPEFVNAHGADLLVLGSVGRSGLDGFLIGNTAEEILNQVQCSILALKPKGFVSPLARSNDRTEP